MIATEIDLEQVVQFCQRHPIQRMALFGSVLREDFTPQSDIDFLVEFLPNAKVGMFDVAGMEIELTNIVGRKADIRTAGELSQYFRADVESAAKVIYERP